MKFKAETTSLTLTLPSNYFSLPIQNSFSFRKTQISNCGKLISDLSGEGGFLLRPAFQFLRSQLKQINLLQRALNSASKKGFSELKPILLNPLNYCYIQKFNMIFAVLAINHTHSYSAVFFMSSVAIM